MSTAKLLAIAGGIGAAAGALVIAALAVAIEVTGYSVINSI